MVDQSAKAEGQAKIERFSIPEPNSGCWLWTGSMRTTGYGCVNFNGKTMGAHRLSYESYKGSTGDLHVLHRCDMPACVNPDHLYIGTNKVNAYDRERRGRMLHPVGSEHPRAKLTDDDVRFILTTDISSRQLGRRFGVDRTTVRKIRTGENWRHIYAEVKGGQP